MLNVPALRSNLLLIFTFFSSQRIEATARAQNKEPSAHSVYFTYKWTEVWDNRVQDVEPSCVLPLMQTTSAYWPIGKHYNFLQTWFTCESNNMVKLATANDQQQLVATNSQYHIGVDHWANHAWVGQQLQRSCRCSEVETKGKLWNSEIQNCV